MKNFSFVSVIVLTLLTCAQSAVAATSSKATLDCATSSLNQILLQAPVSSRGWEDTWKILAKRRTETRTIIHPIQRNIQAVEGYLRSLQFKGSQPIRYLETSFRTPDPNFLLKWKNSVLENELLLPDYRQVPHNALTKTEGGRLSMVYRFKQPDKKISYFRPMIGKTITKGRRIEDTTDIARRTLAASKLNREVMGLDSVAEAKLARINNTIGVLSKEADDSFSSYDPISSDIFFDTEAFEFLVGNTDVGTHNYNVGKKGKNAHVQVFDHGLAFTYGVTMDLGTIDRKSEFLGLILPNNYTQKFYNSLKTLTRQKLETEMGEILTPSEIDAILFRRGVILEDIRLRNLEDSLIER